MIEILSGVIVLSILHAIIPSHWLPLVSLSKTLHWTRQETLRVTALLAFSHILSTLLVGAFLGVFGYNLNLWSKGLVEKIGPLMLIVFGIYFMYRHHTHQHFHIDEELMDGSKTRKQVVYALMAFMFISPCLEIEGYFFAAAPYGYYFLGMCAILYSVISLAGMVICVSVSLHGMKHFNWHRLEHSAGLISGMVMVVSGVIGIWEHL